MSDSFSSAHEHFMWMLAHDLKTPVSASQMGLEVLASGKLGPVTPAQQEILEGLIQSNQDLFFMLDSLYKIYKIEKEGLQATLSSVNLNTLIETEVAAQASGSKQANVKLQLSSDLPEIELDVGHVKLCIKLLLRSVLNTSSPHCPIEILSYNEPQRVIFTVGSAESLILDSDFQELLSGSSTKKFKTPWRCLDLYLARTMVELLGGLFTGSNNPQESYFSISFPKG